MYVCRCGNIYHIYGQVQRLMFVGVNFLVMFKIFDHIHSVILNRSCEHSSFFVLFCGQTIISVAYYFLPKNIPDRTLLSISEFPDHSDVTRYQDLNEFKWV